MKKLYVIRLCLLLALVLSFPAISYGSVDDKWVELPQVIPGIYSQGHVYEESLYVKDYENYYFENVVWRSSNDNVLEILETTDETVKFFTKNPGNAQIIVEFDFYYESHENTATSSNATSSNAAVLMKHYTCKASYTVTGLEGDFRFFEFDNSIYIYRYVGSSEHVIVPGYINGKPVTSIGRCGISGNTIKQITLPATVTDLILSSIYECSNLEIINLPDSLAYVGDYAITGCPSLLKVVNESSLDINLSNFKETLEEDLNTTWFTEETGGILLDGVLPANSTMYRQFPIYYHIEGASQQDVDTMVGKSKNPIRYSPLHDTTLYNLSNYNGSKFDHWEWQAEDSTYQTISQIDIGTLGAIDLYAVYSGSTSNNNSFGSSGSSAKTLTTGSQNYAAITNLGEVITTGTYQTAGQWKQEGTVWTYLDSGQNVITNKWISYQGKWYLTDQSGVMVTGWQKVNGGWYLFASDGSMLTGWQYVNYKWYFMTPDGYLVNSAMLS